MPKFLLCVDDTEFSEAAVPAVRELAEESSAETELVHVLVTGQVDTGEPWSGTPRTAEETRVRQLAERRNSAEERLQRIAAAFRTPVSAVILEAPDAARAIVEHAERSRPTLVALTTHSKVALGERHLGSVAERLTLSGVAPVLLVYPPDEWSIDPAALSEGCFVFTADGIEIGEVAEVANGAFKVQPPGREPYWLPAGAAAAINTGRIVLHHDEAVLERHTVPAPS